MDMHTICTRQLVPCMMNPDIPNPIISRVSFQSTRRCSVFMRSSALFPVRNRRTQTQETIWLSTVASAAPPTPISSKKMKTGSSTRFSTAPIRVVSIPILGNPWALIKPFSPVASMVNVVPNK